ncbi:MAG: hypothetical protein P8Y84_04505 [Desulfuromonadales bacterium]
MDQHAELQEELDSCLERWETLQNLLVAEEET